MIDHYTPAQIAGVKAQLERLHGRATIELFEHGKKIHEQTEDNLITNYINKLLSLPESMWMYNTANYSQYLDSMMPIATNLMGGVYLWDDELPEDADIVLPPAGIGCVGYAGSAYSGTNPYRGTHNKAESGAIEGGYRHVWDFATNQGNGTIKSLSLTTTKGGNTGWRNYNADAGTEQTYLAVYNGNNIYNMVGRNTAYQGYPIMADFSGDRVRVYSYYSGKLTRYDLPQINHIGLLDGRTGTAAVTKTDLATVENREHMYFYDNKFWQVWTSSTTQIRAKSWDLSGTAVDDITLTISGVTAIKSETYNSYAVYLNGKYYVKTSSGWAQLDDTGAYVAMVTTNASNGGYPTQIAGLVYDPKSRRAMLSREIYNASDTGNYGYILDTVSNDFTRQYEFKSDVLLQRICTNMQEPWMSGNGGVYYTYKDYNDPFGITPPSFGLASINNLTSPITKTSTQSAKITYEITQEV